MGVVRILLAVWVLVVHSGPLFGVVGPGRPVNLGLNGDMSVTCFFVISGFLIAMIRNRRPTAVRAFYVSRAMRIYALYLLALALTVTVGWLTGLDRGRFEAIGAVIASGNLAAAIYALTANLFVFGTELAVYLASTSDAFADLAVFAGQSQAMGDGWRSWTDLLLIPQAWTLSLELQFYLLAPLLCRIKPGLLGLGTMLYAILQEAVLHRLEDLGLALNPQGSILFQLQYFLFGLLAFAIYDEFQKAEFRRVVKTGLCAAMVALAFILVLAGYAIVGIGSASGMMLYLAFALCVPFLFAAFRDSRLDRAIGELSYPIYLFHYCLVPVAGLWATEASLGLTTLALTLVPSLAYLLLLHRRLENWRYDLRDRLMPAGSKPGPRPLAL